ncbi:hypothetical protein [Micromonospora sp. AKA38]|uniref:hypothetical protein n=1 Tax=Micromonospora sp. AKA38 TaxID=2733861 RepID=UPI0022BCF26E|nr:hypothetical protein [Micromonospora sp. AKA38]GHJ15300.1 hypothetical protein TPA0908_32950 [Micromonospora sp. AKA38]
MFRPTPSQSSQVSARELAEDGAGAVLRLVNPTSAEVVATVSGLAGGIVEGDLVARPTGGAVLDDRIPLGPFGTRGFRGTS